MNNMDNRMSGGLVPNTSKAIEQAFKMYEQIRRRKTDCLNIARNTGFSIEQVQIIKNYIFYDSHKLTYGYSQFYPCYEMAESWRRLSEKNGINVQKHDVLLLYHELYEISLLISNSNYSQSHAHFEAEKKYNYSLESDRFYNIR